MKNKKICWFTTKSNLHYNILNQQDQTITMTITNFKTLHKTSGVALNGNYCYVADADTLCIYDINSGTLNLLSDFAQGAGYIISL